MHAVQNRDDKRDRYPYPRAEAEQRGVSAISSQEIDVDLRSKSVRKGDLYFHPDGTVDKRSPAVVNGQVLVTSSGSVDGRSASVKAGQITFKGDTSGVSYDETPARYVDNVCGWIMFKRTH